MNGRSGRDATLLATMLNVVITGMCDPTRLGKGRTYARQGAVGELSVEPGELRASVQGSRAQPYDVVVRTVPADADTLSGLTLAPSADELRFECSCPDWDEPCKHAIAVMAAFAERVGEDASLLSTWRGDVATSGPRAVVGSRGQPRGGEPVDDGRDGRRGNAVDPDELTTDQTAAIDAFLGVSGPPPPTLGALARGRTPAELTDEPWTSMLRDALATMAR